MKTSIAARLVLALLATATSLAASAPGPAAGVRAAQDPTPGQPAQQAAAPADAARAAWDRLLAAAVTAETGGRPIEAFDLYFDGRARPRAAQSNDFDAARFRYHAPGYVRTTLHGDRESLRGPEGDFALEGERAVELVGRDYKEDRRELDERLAIARNFTALSNPANIRVQDLAPLAGTPRPIPESLRARADALEWITLRSPDLRVVQSSLPIPNEAGSLEGPLFRVQLGLDRETGLVALATIAEELGSAPKISSSLLIDLRRYRAMDGFQVPGEVRTHHPADGPRAEWRFDEKPVLELWLLEGGTLRPQFGPEAFLP